MSLEENKSIAERFLVEAYRKKNLKIGDELLAANVVMHGIDIDLEGIEAWKKYAKVYLNTFSEINIIVDDAIAEGDKVVVRWSALATYKDEEVKLGGIGVVRLKNGKIVDIWGCHNIKEIMQQLGVIPQ
jgi:predicted ester cyclase